MSGGASVTPWAELVAAVQALQAEVAGLRRDLIPGRILRRWTAVVVVGLLAVMAAAVAWNRITLSQAADRQAEYVRALVRDCSLPRLTAQQLTFCRSAIPRYDESRAAQAQRAAELDSLRKWAISRGWTPPPTTRPGG